MLFVMSGLFAMFYFASLYVQEVLGYSPLKAGLAFLPVTAGIVIGAGLSQARDQAISARRVPLIGVALAARRSAPPRPRPDARLVPRRPASRPPA